MKLCIDTTICVGIFFLLLFFLSIVLAFGYRIEIHCCETNFSQFFPIQRYFVEIFCLLLFNYFCFGFFFPSLLSSFYNLLQVFSCGFRFEIFFEIEMYQLNCELSISQSTYLVNLWYLLLSMMNHCFYLFCSSKDSCRTFICLI